MSGSQGETAKIDLTDGKEIISRVSSSAVWNTSLAASATSLLPTALLHVLS